MWYDGKFSRAYFGAGEGLMIVEMEEATLAGILMVLVWR
jgi:hypothetical protein